MVDVKNMCFTGTKCEKCAHFEVCKFKADHVKAQEEIKFFRFALFDGLPVRLNECEWVKPLEVVCKFYSPKSINIRDTPSGTISCGNKPSYYMDVQLTNSNKTEGDEQ